MSENKSRKIVSRGTTVSVPPYKPSEERQGKVTGSVEVTPFKEVVIVPKKNKRS